MKTQDRLNKLFKKEQIILKSTPYISNRFNKDGNLSKRVSNLIKNCRIVGNKIYYFTWTGSGRYINPNDNSLIKDFIIFAGFKYKEGNDAVRGGKEGNYIKVSKQVIEFLNEITY